MNRFLQYAGLIALTVVLSWSGVVKADALHNPSSGNLVDDTTPSLGGDLDVNGKKIASSSDIILKLGDNAGVNKVIIQDSDSAEVAAIDSDGTITAGDLHITQTAIGDNQHVINITVDGAGFGDIKSFDVDYTTGNLQAGDDSAVMLINIDESGASGGEVFAIQVLATEGNVTVVGLNVGQGVEPIRQSSGTTGDIDSFLIIAVDKLTEALSAATADLPYFLADNDTITIGDAAKFDAMTFAISTGASANGIVPVFEFWNGGAWVAFTPVDGTDGWRSTGTHIVDWDLIDISTWAVDANTEYVIQVTRTKGTLITTPVGSQVQIASSTVRSWNKDGDLDIRGLTLSGDIALTGGNITQADGDFAASGDARTQVFVLRKSTTDVTQTELFTDGSAGTIAVASDCTLAFRISIVARRTDGDNESAIYLLVGGIDNNAGTTALVGTVSKSVIAEDTAAWDVAITANNTNDSITVLVTGENAKTIRWVARAETTEVCG